MGRLLLLRPGLLLRLILLLLPILVAADWWLGRKLLLVVNYCFVERFGQCVGSRR